MSVRVRVVNRMLGGCGGPCDCAALLDSYAASVRAEERARFTAELEKWRDNRSPKDYQGRRLLEGVMHAVELWDAP